MAKLNISELEGSEDIDVDSSSGFEVNSEVQIGAIKPQQQSNQVNKVKRFMNIGLFIAVGYLIGVISTLIMIAFKV